MAQAGAISQGLQPLIKVGRPRSPVPLRLRDPAVLAADADVDPFQGRKRVSIWQACLGSGEEARPATGQTRTASPRKLWSALRSRPLC